MKIKPNMRFAKLALASCVTISLAACGNGAPSESDAKQAIKNALGDCKYFELRDFQKVNGLPGDSGNDYRVDVKYTIRPSPDSDIKAYARQWKDQYDKYQSLNADAEQKAKQYYDNQQAYTAANPNDLDAGRTFEHQHQDEYQAMSNAKIEVGNAAAALNNTAPGLVFRRAIVQACPSIDLRLLTNFFNGKGTDYSNDVDVEFTQTIDMIKTDNGWQAAR
ncbi:hypothetical protein [Burkholderia vietnamiensis]|uniref:hypothetical protein n=1 Tax=Burkholderia vietnamiensis TaxID=60552 RepID=UPI001CF52BE3|nr:hypothetical protein [Burkholderia vietnamiensis]MCA7988698.1 hypothetical protein [Burkholderia vietnamiensis]HDR8934483.1 hypothetical protein [Burkholderia vietnamiensis]